ncbi:MAG: hypothetical protein PHG67_06090 [Bacteroidales bacterium]|jgi:hypothetical protein|nr:hypothetical protein [Bacteroidales bacterium]HOI31210.1 hypothetical protein [Bacteroidales bacterium]
MSNQRKQAELAAMRQVAESHRILLHAMLTNHEAYMALLQAAEETGGNSKIQDSKFKDSKIQDSKFKDSKMKVLR